MLFTILTLGFFVVVVDVIAHVNVDNVNRVVCEVVLVCIDVDVVVLDTVVSIYISVVVQDTVNKDLV